MSYLLENQKEFDRLEDQSSTPAYDYRKELEGFTPKRFANILDAGCGSGVVSRHLATTYPESSVTGCDLSPDRVKRAQECAHSIPNLRFEVQDLTRSTFGAATFDAAICRYVVEHLSEAQVKSVFREFHRVLRPNGQVCIVDMDGFLYNLYPQTAHVTSFLGELEKARPVDLNIGRKIPAFLSEAGFTDVRWRIDTLEFKGGSLETEARLLEERFAQVGPHLGQAMGVEKVECFFREYLECLRSPDAVLFYNKFVVTARKSGLQK